MHTSAYFTKCTVLLKITIVIALSLIPPQPSHNSSLNWLLPFMLATPRASRALLMLLTHFHPYSLTLTFYGSSNARWALLIFVFPSCHTEHMLFAWLLRLHLIWMQRRCQRVSNEPHLLESDSSVQPLSTNMSCNYTKGTTCML